MVLLADQLYMPIYNDNAIYAIVMSGVFMICAAVSVIYVHDDGDITAIKTKPIA
jgi:maltose/moltooligosaccharide transporter